jgi:hypothetical protein
VVADKAAAAVVQVGRADSFWMDVDFSSSKFKTSTTLVRK